MRPDLSVVMSAGVFGRLLRASLGRLGGSRGPSWGLLAAPERPWAAPGTLGGSWVLSSPEGLLGRSGRLLGHCIKHRNNHVFCVFFWASGASPGGLWGDPGDPLASLGCLLGSPGPSWAGLALGVSSSVLSGPGERPRTVGSHLTSGQVKKSSKGSFID